MKHPPFARRIIPSLLLFFPRLKADTFVAGLMFGAVFSLLVNVITIQIQEQIQKQRVLEAVEGEIAANARLAGRIVDNNTKKMKEDTTPNFFDVRPQYTTKVWGTSEALKYTVQLPGDVQANLVSYYDVLLIGHNALLQKYETLASKYLSDCYGADMPPAKLYDCREWNKVILSGEMESANTVGKESMRLLKTFHPTRDRLGNWLFRLILGSTAIGMLTPETK